MRKCFLFLLSFAFCLSFPEINVACSFNDIVPFKFVTEEYVITGEVIGYTNKVEHEYVNHYKQNIKIQSWGLRVKVEGIINMPYKTDVVEVFPTYLTAFTCDVNGVELQNLQKDFPVGSKVRVIGRENAQIFGNLNGATIKIQVSPTNYGHLFINAGKSKKIMSTTESIFDYKQDPCFPINPKCHKDAFYRHRFEIRKDLVRLENAKSEKEKYEIFQRLAYAPGDDKSYVDALEKYLKDKTMTKELANLRKNWLNVKLSIK